MAAWTTLARESRRVAKAYASSSRRHGVIRNPSGKKAWIVWLQKILRVQDLTSTITMVLCRLTSDPKALSRLRSASFPTALLTPPQNPSRNASNSGHRWSRRRPAAQAFGS